ncbi:AIPR family protein [Desulfitobacterium sp. Sab5]|uniref:AIPR family protein n=1 Tax=Desulfitobacterium nosdiversum TaxID=3375356 RepID=UPI003CE8D89D
MESSKTRLTFPVKSFKKFEDPYNPKETPAKYQFFVNAKNVPSELEFWLDVNPREQKLNTDVSRDIKNSLLSEDKTFHLLNRGILISAEDITFDNVEKKVELVLSDNQKHGIIDGGHTYKIIISEQENIATEKYVSVEVITHVNHIEMLAEARNTSVAVDDKSIEELKGSFDCIKEIIQNQKIGEDKYFNRIAFKQNEFWGDKDKTNVIDVREIIAIMNMFNPYLYNPLEAVHPIQSYTGKEVSLKKFLNLSPEKGKSKAGNVEFRNKVVSNMRSIIPNMFLLWDIIEKEFPQVSRDLNRRYGAKKYSNYGNDKVKKVSLFSNEELAYTVPKGIMYPCLGAFRALVKQNDRTGECSWALDPFKVWEEKKESIVSIILDNSKTAAGDSPDQIGKSSLIWDSLYNGIFIHRLMRKA